MKTRIGWLVAIACGLQMASLGAAAGETAPGKTSKGRPPATRGATADKRPAGTDSATEVLWAKDPKSAFKLSQSTGQPLLLVFSGKRCGWCRKLEKETLSDPQVAQMVNERFIPVHLDLEQHPELGEALEVDGLPTTVVLTAEGEVLGTASGFQAAAKYKRTLKTALARQSRESAEEIQQASAEAPLEKPSKRR